MAISGPAAVKVGASTVNIQFSRRNDAGALAGVQVNGFALSDLSVAPSDKAALSGLTPDASKAGLYTATLTPVADFEGNLTVSIAKDAVLDLRGNPNPAYSFQTRVDSTPPTVAITGPAGPSNGPVELTITFSEPVSKFEGADLTVSGGTAGEISGKDAVYKVTVTPAEDYNGQLTADIAADAAEDIAGNMNTAAEQYAVTIDQTPPTVTVTGPEGPIKDEKVSISIAFSEEAAGFELSDITVANGTASDLTADADTKGLYTAMIQADAGFEGMLTVDIAAGAAADLAGNANTAAEQYSVEVVQNTTFTISLKKGLNLIHVPVKVEDDPLTEDVDERLQTVGDLYDALGGSADVLYVLSHVPSPIGGSFAAYVGIPGSSGDTALKDQTAVIVNMRNAKDVAFTGALLNDTVALTEGINLIGVPRAEAVDLASKVAPNAVAVLALTRDSLGNALFSLVIPDTPTDIKAVGGQGYIVVAPAADSITYTGEAWEDPEDETTAPATAASSESGQVRPDRARRFCWLKVCLPARTLWSL